MAREQRMIEPFTEKQISEGVVSFGLGSFGYDIRLADEFRVFMGAGVAVVDPKNFDERSFRSFRAAVCTIPASSYALGRSMEYFRIPRNVMTVCVGKSTYARCGIITNVTPLEPEWEGYITLAISNTTPVAVKVYAGEGIAQVLFFESDSPPDKSYADRKAKYQKQQGITPPKV